jgi:hypothetical protein
MVPGIGRSYAPGAASDDDRQFRFVLYLCGLGWADDGLAWPDNGAGWFEEDKWLAGHISTVLGGMSGVIASQGDDLGWLAWGKERELA